MKTLYTWIGTNDFNHMEEKQSGSAINSIINSDKFDRIVLLHNYRQFKDYEQEKEKLKTYKEWLLGRNTNKYQNCIEKLEVLSNPTELMSIMKICRKILKETIIPDSDIYFNLSSGTWAMSWVWFFLSQTNNKATLLQSSPEAGVQSVEIPFEISGQKLFQEWQPKENETNEAEKLFDPFMPTPYRNYRMKKTIHKAMRAARTDMPILIIGETGCPKKQLARGIYRNSQRYSDKKNYYELDCFYYKEKSLRPFLEKAEGGTVFLENIDHLNEENQRLIFDYVLNHFVGEIESYGTETMPVNSDSEKSDPLNFSGKSEKLMNIKLIFSSSTTIEELKKCSHFSSDFLDSITMIMLNIPPLRERTEDIAKIIEGHFKKFKKLNKSDTVLSETASDILSKYHWPGNDVELDKVLQQLILFAHQSEISNAEVMEALFELPADSSTNSFISKPLEKGFNLRDHLNDEAKRFILRAEADCGGNLNKMAVALGFENRQTLGARMKSLGMRD